MHHRPLLCSQRPETTTLSTGHWSCLFFRPGLRAAQRHDSVAHRAIAHRAIALRAIALRAIAHRAIALRAIAHRAIALRAIAHRAIAHRAIALRAIAHRAIAHRAIALRARPGQQGRRRRCCPHQMLTLSRCRVSIRGIKVTQFFHRRRFHPTDPWAGPTQPRAVRGDKTNFSC